WNAVSAPGLLGYLVELTQGSVTRTRSVGPTITQYDWIDASPTKAFTSKIYTVSQYGMSVASNYKTGATQGSPPAPGWSNGDFAEPDKEDATLPALHTKSGTGSITLDLDATYAKKGMRSVKFSCTTGQS